jgi:protein TonB
VHAGALISLAGHAAVIAVALWALPWLAPRPSEPVPAVQVRLVSPDELAAAEAAATRGAMVPADPRPVPVPAAPDVQRPEPEPLVAPEAPSPEPPEPEMEIAVLAPSFDPVAPLGPPQPEPLAVPLEAPPEPLPERLALVRPGAEAAPGLSPPLRVAERPRPRPPPAPARVPAASPPVAGAAGAAAGASAGSAPGPGAAALREGYWAAVRAAIARAQVYPRAARERGVEGAAVLRLVVGRDGHLRLLRLTRSSGSAVLDRASVDAARTAGLPVPPPALGDGDLDFAVTLRFEIAGD